MKTKNEAQHTPTPWIIEGLQAGFVILGDVKGQDENGIKHTETVAEVGQRANAAYIVKAVNCHSIVERLAKFDGCYGGGEPMDFADYRLNVKAIVDEARKAIANAEGK